MNDKRRRKLMEAEDLLSKAKEIVEAVMFEEEDALNGLPENFTYSERAEAMEEAVGNLDSALMSIEDAEESITEARG